MESERSQSSFAKKEENPSMRRERSRERSPPPSKREKSPPSAVDEQGETTPSLPKREKSSSSKKEKISSHRRERRKSSSHSREKKKEKKSRERTPAQSSALSQPVDYMGLCVGCTTFPQIFIAHLQHFPHYAAVSSLDNKGIELPKHRMSFAQLMAAALDVAEWLPKNGVSRGSRVLLVFLPCVDFLVSLWGCIIAGVIPIPSPPPLRLSSDLPSFSALIRTVGATHCLSHNEYKKISTVLSARTKMSGLFSGGGTQWPSISWLYVDGTSLRRERKHLMCPISSRD
jgi:hypothetical protein